jgi:hypothetical protein
MGDRKFFFFFVLCEGTTGVFCFFGFLLVITARIAITQYIFRRQVAYINRDISTFYQQRTGHINLNSQLKILYT